MLFRNIALIFSSEKPCYLENRVSGGAPVHTFKVMYMPYNYQWKEWCGNFGEQLLCLCENKAEISLKAFEKQNS